MRKTSCLMAIILIISIFLFPEISLSSKCSELFQSIFSPSVVFKVGDKSISINSMLKDKLDNLKQGLINSKATNVVVYVPIETSKGIANIRYEYIDKNENIDENLIANTDMTLDEFQSLMKISQSPSASFVRNTLERTLFKANANDSDKLIFFKDIYYYGMIPPLFNKGNAIMLGDHAPSEAISNLDRLKKMKINTKDISLFTGYPDTTEDYLTVFGDTNSDDLGIWIENLKQLKLTAEKHNVKFFSSQEFRSLTTKDKLLKQLEESKTIIFIVAHANGCHVKIPGGGQIDIVPEDIENLSFKYMPFVMVRICNGVDNGYADAFLKAGACGVWINRGIISPKTANDEVERFLSSIDNHSNIIEMINAVQGEGANSKYGSGLFVQYYKTIQHKLIIQYLNQRLLEN